MTFYRKDNALTEIGDQILTATWAEFPTLARNQLALTWIIYDQGFPIHTGGAVTVDEFWKHQPRGFSYRSVESIYPASVVKLFYMVAFYEWVEKNMLQSTPELERAVTDMIVDSSNDATGLIVDILTGTTSGPELSAGPFEAWKSQRNLVNRYYQALGWDELQSCNINQKTWGDGPYGRERAFYGENYENRNMLTTDAVARLVHAIVGGVAVSPKASKAMMELMQRSLEPEDWKPDPENQIGGFIGEGLIPDGQSCEALCWSKAGWMSRVRHDAAYVELPDGRPFTLVIFNEGKEHVDNDQIFPFITRQIAKACESL